MWPPPNIQSLPSKQEIQIAKKEISTIELEIVETELRLDALRKSLSKRKAWIAPIRTTPPEILSLIFTEASKSDWKAPLVLQRVSRQWRNVVMDSPKAWTFIPLSKHSSGRRSELILLFLERSRNTGLHISDWDDSLFGYMHLLTDRIECFRVGTRNLPNYYLQRGYSFHRLERLSIDSNLDLYPAEGAPAAWDMSLFPNLKILHIGPRSHPLLRAISTAPEFPAIQHLTVYCLGTSKPLDILTKCATSLESVLLTYDNEGSEALDVEYKIHFPLLKYLHLAEWSTVAAPRFRLEGTTPNLQAYLNERPIFTLNTVKVDTDSVTLLEVVCAPDLSQYPRLVTLSFGARDAKGEETLKAIESLRDNPALCPDLTLIEYRKRMTQERLVKAKEALMARGEVTGHVIQLSGNPKVRKEREQMFKILEPCGTHMLCQY